MRWISLAAGLAVALLIWSSSWSRSDEPDAVALDERMLKDARIAADGPSLLEFFRKRTISSTDIERIKKLVTDLGDDAFEVRQNASAQLIAIGPRATRFLKEAEKNTDDIEVVRR